MNKIRALLQEHQRTLIAALPKGAIQSFVDSKTWYAGVPLPHADDGVYLNLAVYIRDTGTPVLKMDFRMTCLNQDFDFVFNDMLLFGKADLALDYLRDEMTRLAMDPALADTEEARAMIQYVAGIHRDLDEVVQFSGELVPYSPMLKTEGYLNAMTLPQIGRG